LRELADRVVTEIEDIDGVNNPESGASTGVPQLQVAIDNDKAATYGLTADAIQSQINMYFIGQVVTQYREEGHEIDVSIMYPGDSRPTISELENMTIATQSGAQIPLTELADFTEEDGPVTLIRQNQQAQMNVTSDVTGRDLSSVVTDIESKLGEMNLPE